MGTPSPDQVTAMLAAADRNVARRTEEIEHLVDIQLDMIATIGRTQAAALTCKRAVDSMTQVGLAEMLAVALTLLAEQRTPPVDPTRSPDPELCAGPVQITGVEGWACGRGLALTSSKEQPDA